MKFLSDYGFCETIKEYKKLTNTRESSEHGVSPEKLQTNPEISWRDISKGGAITKSGNSEEFNTGDWRSSKPVFVKDKCKQCLLCCPVCPDSSIPVNSDGQRNDFDYKHCKGCGICAQVCPFGAIIMEDE